MGGDVYQIGRSCKRIYLLDRRTSLLTASWVFPAVAAPSLYFLLLSRELGFIYPTLSFTPL